MGAVSLFENARDRYLESMARMKGRTIPTPDDRPELTTWEEVVIKLKTVENQLAAEATQCRTLLHEFEQLREQSFEAKQGQREIIIGKLEEVWKRQLALAINRDELRGRFSSPPPWASQ